MVGDEKVRIPTIVDGALWGPMACESTPKKDFECEWKHILEKYCESDLYGVHSHGN